MFGCPCENRDDPAGDQLVRRVPRRFGAFCSSGVGARALSVGERFDRVALGQRDPLLAQKLDLAPDFGIRGRAFGDVDLAFGERSIR